MNKFLASVLILHFVTACGAPQKNQVIWTHPNNNISQFEMDKASCEIAGLDAAGPKPTFLNYPSCGYRRGYSMMLSSDCATYQHRVSALNRRLHEAWLSDFELGYNPCMFEKGYKLQTNQ